MLIFQNNSENNEFNNVASISNQQLSSLEHKLTKLESAINNIQGLTPYTNLQNAGYIQESEIDHSMLEQLSDTISSKLSYELEGLKEQERIEQERIEQEEIAAQYEQSNQDEQLSQFVFSSIQPGASNRMSNIKEVMQSEQMHAMTAEGRERVVKEIVRMANNGELDIATFFGKGQ